MRNVQHWSPSKYAVKGGRLVGSRDSAEVAVSSRLAADLTGAQYGIHLGKHCRGRLLDLGCGKVPLFQAYRDYIEENICVDWVHGLHGRDHLDCMCNLSRGLPFRSETFDTIILSDVLEHIAEPGKLWPEMSRLLRPRGKILLNVPFYYGVHEAPHDYYRYTEFALRRFANLAQLRVVYLEAIGGTPEILTDLIAKPLARLTKLGQHGSALIQFMCRRFVATGLGRQISTDSATYFPFLYFMIAQKEMQPSG